MNEDLFMYYDEADLGSSSRRLKRRSRTCVVVRHKNRENGTTRALDI
jgi:hypothetical protein